MSVSSTNIQTDRAMALAAYILHLIGSVTGLLSIAALILNYVRRNDIPPAGSLFSAYPQLGVQDILLLQAGPQHPKAER